MAEELVISERSGLGIATIMARKGSDAAAIAAAIGVVPPASPAWVSGPDISLLGTGPGTWLAFAEGAAPGWAAEMERKLTGLASVSDQTGGYAIFRFSGTKARELLQRGAFIDLDNAVFVPGCAATTVIAHIGVIIWQVDDVPTFDVALFRSFAGSFRSWIESVAAALQPVPENN